MAESQQRAPGIRRAAVQGDCWGHLSLSSMDRLRGQEPASLQELAVPVSLCVPLGLPSPPPRHPDLQTLHGSWQGQSVPQQDALARPCQSALWVGSCSEMNFLMSHV